MSTALDRIERALRLLSVIAASETVEAGIAADSLDVLNAMLAEWEAAGFGFVAPTFTALGSTDTLPEADWEAVSANLAVRMAREFEMDPPAVVAAGAAASLGQLHARYNVPGY